MPHTLDFRVQVLAFPLALLPRREEVIRHHCKAPKDADEQTLRSVAKKTIHEEGYDPEVADLSLRR